MLYLQPLHRAGNFEPNTLPLLPSNISMENNLYIDQGAAALDQDRYVVAIGTYQTGELYKEIFDRQKSSAFTIDQNCYYFRGYQPKVSWFILVQVVG
jgi:hypothetical protein